MNLPLQEKNRNQKPKTQTLLEIQLSQLKRWLYFLEKSQKNVLSFG
jgi:hypothetical protein